MPSLPISTSGSGAQVIVPARGGDARARVFGLALQAATNVTCTVQDTAGNALSGPLSLQAGIVTVLPIGGSAIDPLPWMTSSNGLGVQLALSAAVAVVGVVVYDYAN